MSEEDNNNDYSNSGYLLETRARFLRVNDIVKPKYIGTIKNEENEVFDGKFLVLEVKKTRTNTSKRVVITWKDIEKGIVSTYTFPFNKRFFVIERPKDSSRYDLPQDIDSLHIMIRDLPSLSPEGYGTRYNATLFPFEAVQFMLNYVSVVYSQCTQEIFKKSGWSQETFQEELNRRLKLL